MQRALLQHRIIRLLDCFQEQLHLIKGTACYELCGNQEREENTTEMMEAEKTVTSPVSSSSIVTSGKKRGRPHEPIRSYEYSSEGVCPDVNFSLHSFF